MVHPILPRLINTAEASTSSPSTTLSRAIPDIFSLYRALMPVAHPAKIRDVPALAMQFANDCEWLAGEAGRLEGEGASGQVKMREMGERWFGLEVVSLKSHLVLCSHDRKLSHPTVPLASRVSRARCPR